MRSRLVGPFSEEPLYLAKQELVVFSFSLVVFLFFLMVFLRTAY